MVQRQPFPGPGLAIRIIGEVTAERLETLREADWIVIDEIKAAGLYRSVWQSFAILTPVRSVGVMGDGRTYANVVAIRAVTSDDGMTADWAKLPYDVLGKISSRIVNEVPGGEPGGLRHQLEAAGHDRVGVARPAASGSYERVVRCDPGRARVSGMVKRNPRAPSGRRARSRPGSHGRPGTAHGRRAAPAVADAPWPAAAPGSGGRLAGCLERARPGRAARGARPPCRVPTWRPARSAAPSSMRPPRPRSRA